MNLRPGADYGTDFNAKSAKQNAKIARSDASPELPERAIYWIAHRSGPEATDVLVSLYDEQKE
jgi:hypothetical protein